ncbi:hypothetical protein O181_067787 [Austropuccinia psidii MF-1]|uniref:Uncharacterized protein n=1 Tax=Austropuccinia psidii MF-1 TaxID=1389203 RepID=A0A9Q3I5N0_9BASI|nr:hypothetical protein [Austropuccinia psidii MF-1]
MLQFLIRSSSVRYWYKESTPEIRKTVFLALEENLIPLETQSQGNTPVIPSEPEGKGKGKRHSEGLITIKKWKPIATQTSRKPQTSASIQGKPTLTTCTVKITVICHPYTSSTLKSQGTSQRTEKAFSEPEDLEQDTLDTVVDGKTLREIIPTLPFTFQFKRNLEPEDWKDMDKVLQIHELLKDLFQWSMENKRLELASYWADLGETFQKIYLKEIPLKDLMVITKGWNPTRKFRLLEEPATTIRENKETIQAREQQLNKTGPTLIPSGSQVVDQPNFPVASHHPGTSRSVAKSHHHLQSQVVSRRREG